MPPLTPRAAAQVDPNGDGLTAPRHYTTTSPPGEKYLQCTTKKVAGGVVSTYMHEALKVGDTVKLTPPYGVFTLDQELPTGVLVSAGIGVTPMINFARALGDKTALVVHVDKTEAAHAFKAEFEPYKTLFVKPPGPIFNIFPSLRRKVPFPESSVSWFASSRSSPFS